MATKWQYLRQKFCVLTSNCHIKCKIEKKSGHVRWGKLLKKLNLFGFWCQMFLWWVTGGTAKQQFKELLKNALSTAHFLIFFHENLSEYYWNVLINFNFNYFDHTWTKYHQNYAFFSVLYDIKYYIIQKKLCGNSI